MLIATFNETTGWAGKRITYETGHFLLEGHGRISPINVMSYDEKGQLRWADHGIRAWVGGLAQTQPASRPKEVAGQKEAVRRPVIQKNDQTNHGRGRVRLLGDGGVRKPPMVRLRPDTPATEAGLGRRETAPGTTSDGSRFLVATFNDTTPLRGRKITYQRERFRLEGHGVVSAQSVMKHDRRGELAWANEEMRGWVLCKKLPEERARASDSASQNGGKRLLATVGSCLVLGGHGLRVRNGQSLDLVFGPDQLELQDRANGRICARIHYAQISALEIGGPGEQTSGGGFIGGGFGLEGMVEGMLIATALNLLTTRSTVTTVVCLRIPDGELFMQTSSATPDALRIRLSPVFTRLRQIEAANTRRLTSAAQSGPIDIADQLSRLADLRQRGMLTDQEYTAAKQKVLEGT